MYRSELCIDIKAM